MGFLISIVSLALGAVIGALIATVFLMKRYNVEMRNKIFGEIHLFLSQILHISAPESQSKKADTFLDQWSMLNRSLQLVSIPREMGHQLNKQIVDYLEALDGLHNETVTRQKVDYKRAECIKSAHIFFKRIGYVVSY